VTVTILEAPTMTTRERADAPDDKPLGAGWRTAIVAIGAMAALVALGGMILSFRAVSTEMIPAFGRHWSWLVPIVTDLTVFVFSGVDLVLARLDMSHPLARITVYGATGGTVYLNFNAAGTMPGRIAHVLMPSIWVVFVELMRHVVRHQTSLANGTRREPIPAARWILAPWPTMKLWRRMVLWRVNSYMTALAAERVRLARIAAVREEHGPFWRWRVSALDRLSIGLAEPETGDPAAGQQPETDRTAVPEAPDTVPEQAPDTPDRTVRTPRPDKDRTAPPVARRPDSPDKRQRASLPELITACQEYAVTHEMAPEHMTRAQIKEAAEAAGYSVSNDRVTRISAFFDEEAAK
jgi:hypothetical protein